MEKEFQDMPRHYVLCFSGSCCRAGECLRHLAAKYGSPEGRIVKAVNNRFADGEDCRLYKPKQYVRMAYGMLHMYDDVLARHIADLRGEITRSFGNGTYYLMRNGLRAIKPAEQAFISETFRRYGYDGAVFDRYSDELSW